MKNIERKFDHFRQWLYTNDFSTFGENFTITVYLEGIKMEASSEAPVSSLIV